MNRNYQPFGGIDPEEQARRAALTGVLAPSSRNAVPRMTQGSDPPRMAQGSDPPATVPTDVEAARVATSPGQGYNGNPSSPDFSGGITGHRSGSIADLVAADDPGGNGVSAKKPYGGGASDLVRAGLEAGSAAVSGGKPLYGDVSDSPNTGPLDPRKREGGVVDSLAPSSAPSDPGAKPADGATAPNASWDTDGFATPAFTAPPARYGLPGFEDDKLADPNHQSPKYVWGRIAGSNMKDGKLDVQAAAAQLLQAYPGATFDGKDKASIPGVGTVDLVRGASAGINAPTWQPVDEGGGGGGGAAAGGGAGVSPLAPFDAGGYTGGSLAAANPLTSESTYSKLMQQLKTILGGQDPERAALDRVLGGK